MSGDVRTDSIYYEEADSSRVSSIYYEQPVAKTSQNEDIYDYTSPVPVDYEVPDSLSDAGPETPERDYKPPPTYPPPNLHSREDEEYDHMNDGRKVYTTLTHTHIPSVYSTPSHSMEFRTNTAVSESVLDIVNLESNSSSPVPTHKDRDAHPLYQSCMLRSRAKVAIFVFLLVAVVVGMVSLVVSVVAVLATSGSDGSDNTENMSGTVSLEEMMALQEEVQRLQTTVDQVMNQTTASVDLSSFFDSCDTDTRRNRCNPESGPGVEFSCVTGTLPYEKEGYITLDRTCHVIGSMNYPATATFLSIDGGVSVYCDCHVMESDLLTFDRNTTTGVQCVMNMLRCPLQQILNVTITSQSRIST